MERRFKRIAAANQQERESVADRFSLIRAGGVDELESISTRVSSKCCQMSATAVEPLTWRQEEQSISVMTEPTRNIPTANMSHTSNHNHRKLIHSPLAAAHNQKLSRSWLSSSRSPTLVAAVVALLLAAASQVALVSAAAITDPPSATSGSEADSAHKQQPVAQARVGGLDPNDYVDEAGELDIMANQQQIPTAQLMSAAGHLVPDNFFLPGSSIPALSTASRYAALQLHQQVAATAAAQQQQQQQSADMMQQVGSHVHARHVVAPSQDRPTASAKYHQLMLAAAASGQLEPQESQQLIDYNGYNLVAASDPRDTAAQTDLAEFLASSSAPVVPMFESASQHQVVHRQPAAPIPADSQQQSQAAQHPGAQQQAQRDREREQMIAAATEQQIVNELAILHQQRDQQAHQMQQQVAQLREREREMQDSLLSQASESAPVESYGLMASAAGGANIGPEYQIAGMHPHDIAQAYGGGYESSGKEQQQNGNQRPFGLPTKSSNKEPPGMLKPLGNPKTISSPAIDFVANQLPKTTQLEKLADKIPPVQTPTVFSFASSKDPMDKVKAVNQKKRNVMKQAEQIARMMIKSINEKFGTNLGDQTDIPFLLSSFGPLGFAQNVLFDPTLLVTLLNSAEKTYQSDVLPGPVKMAMRPVLNIFRVPNKKRDKANLLNVLSYLASGGQTGSPTKHRQGTGIEKHIKVTKGIR